MVMQQVLNSEERYKQMIETPIPRLVTQMAIPTVISMLVTVIYSTADTYFVSQINKSASAAVGMGYSFYLRFLPCRLFGAAWVCS